MVVCFFFLILVGGGVIMVGMIRSAAVAGAFYPGDPVALRRLVGACLREAEDFLVSGLKGVVVPHAGYVYSGATAGYGYRALQFLSEKPAKVFLLGPAHHVSVSVSVGHFGGYETPLGTCEVDQNICAELLRHEGVTFVPEAHYSEHSLEVQVPFLQTVLPDAQIVPLLCGTVDPVFLAGVLASYFLREDTFFVISSDLSHYLPYEVAQGVDKNTIEIVSCLDFAREDQIEACGEIGVRTMMHLAQDHGAAFQLLDYRNSGDTAGDRRRVVGYAAMAVALGGSLESREQ